MPRLTHLNALQALDMALREGSLQGAARRLGITPAAVGQRIRALEHFLGTDLLLRGRSGLQPTQALDRALRDLRTGFDALDRVAAELDFQRTTEIHVVADPDWSELWLMPRLDRFRAEHPNIHFNVNGLGDIPMRLGAPDVRVGRGADDGEALFAERYLPVTSPENAARLTGHVAPFATEERPQYLPVGGMDDARRYWHHVAGSLEGYPLLHVQHRPDQPATPGWPDWVAAFGIERTAPDRGVRYAHMRHALEGARSSAGAVITGLSFVIDEVEAGTLALPYPPSMSIPAEESYRVRLHESSAARPQVARFRDWLRAEAAATTMRFERAIRQAPPMS